MFFFLGLCQVMGTIPKPEWDFRTQCMAAAMAHCRGGNMNSATSVKGYMELNINIQVFKINAKLELEPELVEHFGWDYLKSKFI